MKKEDKFDSIVSKFYVSSNDFEIFEGLTNIQSMGIDGLANKEINCFFNTLEVPKKPDC
jgi:hypothetical protein